MGGEQDNLIARMGRAYCAIFHRSIPGYSIKHGWNRAYCCKCGRWRPMSKRRKTTLRARQTRTIEAE